MKHSTRTLRTLFFSILILSCTLGSTPPAVAADFFAGQVIKRELASGRLSAIVKQQIDLTGSSELLVVMNDDDVQGEAALMRRSLKTDIDNDEVLRGKARLLKEKKGRLLANLPASDYDLMGDYEHFAVLHLQVTETALARLLDDPAVASIQENRKNRHFLTQSLPLIGQPQVQARGFIGTGTAVAVLDTGVDYTLSAFGNCTAPGIPADCKVIYAKDIAPNDGKLDDNGHGTNVAGIVVGVAPGTKIIALDVFRTDGYAYNSDLLSALNWVLSNRSSYNIVAVNMSLGGGQYSSTCGSDPLAGPISNLKNAGILSAIASGNDGYTGSISSPGCVPTAVSVGAVYDSNLGSVSWTTCSDSTTAADMVTCFTNMSDFMTILAPGAWITAAGKTYAGTSQATPHVAGAIAVIKGAQPALTSDEVISRLTGTGSMVSVTRQTASGPVTFQKPRVNLDAALKPAITVNPPSYNFGVVTVGSTTPAQTFTISNSGTSDLIVGTLAIGGTDAPLFTLQGNGCSGQIIHPGSSCTFSVTHYAQSAGSRNATMSIPSNAPDAPLLGVPLNATDLSLFTLSVSRSDNGSITSQPGGIDCGTTCNAQFFQGTVVTLTPSPGIDSSFTGWSGACTGIGTCQPAMDAARSVTASFALLPPARINNLSTSYYPSLVDAYATAASGDTIQLKSGAISGNLLFNRPIGVTIKGGYDGSYSVVTGATTVNGDLTIADGAVTLENLILQ